MVDADNKSAELKIALEAAAAAAEISRGYYRGNISVTIKKEIHGSSPEQDLHENR